MTKYFYGRVSTKEQNLARQEQAAKQAGIEEQNCYYDKISGAKFERPQFDILLDKLQEGDVLVIKSLDRMSRSTKDLLTLMEMFQDKGVDLICLDSNIDTTSPYGKLVFTIFSAFAEFERSIAKQRQKEGREAKIRSTGKCGGRNKTSKEKYDLAINEYLKAERSAADICRTVGISRASLYNELARRGITRD